MRFSIVFDDLPLGFIVKSCRKGDTIAACLREFVSSEDGDLLISRLDGITDMFLSRIPTPVLPSTIDNLLVIIRPDKTASVYINELSMQALIVTRQPLKEASLVFQQDILDVNRVRINITVPPETGFIIVLSNGWRKALYYDITPLHVPGQAQRDQDFELLLGQIWSYLSFQDLFKIDKTTWKTLFKHQWFPFIPLGYPLLKKIVAHAKAGWSVDELMPEIQKELDTVLTRGDAIWKENPYFKDHIPFIERSIEQYKARDHISVNSILYPRIEGIMRSYFTDAGLDQEPSAQNLTREVIKKNAEARHCYSLFLPDRFHEYLNTVYFAHFTPGSSPDVARHSVAHGEARAEAFNEKASIIALLTLHQLALFLSPKPPSKEEAPATAPSDSTESTKS